MRFPRKVLFDFFFLTVYPHITCSILRARLGLLTYEIKLIREVQIQLWRETVQISHNEVEYEFNMSSHSAKERRAT